MGSNDYAALMPRKVFTVWWAWQAAVHRKGNPKGWRSKITLGGQQAELRAGFKARQQFLGSPRPSGLREHGVAYQSKNTLADGRMEAINCNSPLNSPFSAPSLLPWAWLGSFSFGFKNSSVCTTVLTLHTRHYFKMCCHLSLSSFLPQDMTSFSLSPLLSWLRDWS